MDPALESAGGLSEGEAQRTSSTGRNVWMLQRSGSRFGRGLALTTGWALKAALARRGLQQIGNATYDRIDDDGLHIRVEGEPRTLAVDHVVICAGQESNGGLYEQLADKEVECHLIGGAREAGELDALRAIEEGTRLALAL